MRVHVCIFENKLNKEYVRSMRKNANIHWETFRRLTIRIIEHFPETEVTV